MEMRHVIARALLTPRSLTIAWMTVLPVALPAAVGAQPPNYQFILLHPSGFTNSFALGIRESDQVSGGGWSQASTSDERALLWGGAGTQVTSLNPGSGATSKAWAVSGGSIAGIVRTAGMPDSERATLWLANGSSRITLTPPGFGVTFAYD